ncbi:ABC transporter ATP-binding protein [Hydrogenophaga atypica]|uniref:ABC transporter ATP-binding protein n=1 Tax=Hydrogenophaga atypica TaxID=249409 RepID=A0ABW2QGG6_9BURK
MNSAPALQASQLSVSLGSGTTRREVLSGLNLTLRAGAWTAIVGPNGAGKSTLLRALAQLIPHQGSVLLHGQPLCALSPRQRARALAWLAQSGAGEASADDLTVYDVALLGRLPHQAWLAPPSTTDHAAAEAALRQTQAWEWRARPLGALSGGERQRVLLARLLAVQAPVMLMDEPLANLDPPHQADWIALVRALVVEGKTVVSVLHEISLALMADDLVVMRQGQVAYTGPCAQPQAHQTLEAVFDHRITIHPLGAHWVALPTP